MPHMNSFSRRAVMAVAAVALGGVPVFAQTAKTATSVVPAPKAAKPAEFGGPVVGDMAPDFTLPAATRFGLLQKAVKLSDLRGQTVVLAFFPGARTPGCTIQMEKYRDMYTQLFPTSKVVVLGVSVDADTTLADWARDARFPMLFASDAGGSAGTAYGAYDSKYKIEHRLLYVIGPDGKITYVAKPFDVSADASYSSLEDAVKKTL